METKIFSNGIEKTMNPNVKTIHYIFKKKLKLDEMLKYNTHNYRTLRKAVLSLCVAALGQVG